MVKKFMLLAMAFTFMFTVVGANYVDAKPRFKSPRKSFTQTPKKDSSVRSDSGTKAPNTGTTAPKRGFFSGGGLAKGLMIGGLAGLLFGGLFGGLGILGNLLGLMINLLAIYVLFIAVRGIYRMIKNKNRYNTANPYDRDRDRDRDDRRRF
ncbi:hypothetical protein SY83_18140 [Paenibacillus swuensis]|uniref:Preprotein translocase subunit Tim44 n=1 Tax=Paenibacillus swuensis TaxID=1178515 RepID=A0A172TLF9_9BACL|nr:hypothetical protein [Paenibacillus swuensis]ANE47895.1 hypothetical protein SY83_18140 [Paenibacillus swuensis]